MENFEDILCPGPSMTKCWRPQVCQKFDKYLTPQSLQEFVIKSEKVQKLIEFYSKKQNKHPKEIQNEVKLILAEIGLDRNELVIRMCGVVITAMAKRITKGIFINKPNIERVRAHLGRSPVLYLPSHRSYLDFILMSYVCFHYDIEIPGIAAGMDFHAMYGVGSMLRKTGAFFMRRSFSSDDELYWDIFREYVQSMVRSYHIGLEFFVEGTRSRTFKAIPPKVGLLSMALEPYVMGEIGDVTIIPISVSYEKVLEEELFVYEMLGIPKPKESTTGLFKAFKVVQKNFGKMYMDFGEPISARDYFADKDIDRVARASVAAHVQKLNKVEIQVVKDLANEIVVKQQKGIVITTFNLIAVYYSYSQYVGNEVKLAYLCEGVGILKSLFESLGANVATNGKSIQHDIMEALEVHPNILKLFKGTVDLVSNGIEFQPIDPSRLKGFPLSKETMQTAVPIMSLQIYINPCLFWLSNLAYTILGALKLSEEADQISKDDLKTTFNELSAIFSSEFILDDDFERSFDVLVDLGVFEKDGEFYIFKNSHISKVILSSFTPFLCIYLQLAEAILDEFHSSQFKSQEVLRTTQQRVEQFLTSSEKAFVHNYCLALDNLQVAFSSFMKGDCFEQLDNGGFQVNGNNLSNLRELLVNYCQLLPFSFKPSVKLISKL